jgi:hypothetical protein
VKRFNKDPRELQRFQEVNIHGNQILNTLIGDIPYASLGLSYCIESVWYKFHFVGFDGRWARFVQSVVSSPMMGAMKVKSIQYVDLEIA